MIKLVYILIPFLLLGCVSKQVSNKALSNTNTRMLPKKEKIVSKIPSWFINRSLLPKNQEIIGYGAGESFEEAEQIAISNISKQILSIVSSYDKMNTYHTQSNNHEKYNTEFEEHIAISSKAILSNLKNKKSQVVNSVYYIAVSYDNRPILKKIKDLKIDDIKCMKNSNLLFYSQFAQDLNNILGYIPNFNILFQDGMYYLEIGNKQYLLRQNDLKKFYILKYDRDLHLKLSSNTLSEGMFFHLIVQNKKTGIEYLSIVQVDEYGKVIVIIENKKLIKQGTLIYPDLNKFEGIKAHISTNYTDIQELYIAMLCKKKLDYLQLYDDINIKPNTNINAFRYTDLINVLNNTCKISTQVLHIQKKD